MITVTLPKLRLFFNGAILVSSLMAHLACSQNRDPLVGTWTYIEEDIDLYPPNGDYIPSQSRGRKKEPLHKQLRIQKIGKHSVYYHVIPDNRRGGMFKYLNDSTLFEKNSFDTTLLHYHLSDRTLQFSRERNNFLGIHDVYFPKFKRTAYDEVSQIPLTTENFFDFDISNYQSGNINNFVPGRRILPFRISRSFISKRNMTELSIDIRLVQPELHRYDTTGCQARFNFNADGYLKKLTCIYRDGQEQWDFIRRNDLNQSLSQIDFSSSDSTSRPNRTYYYDIDEWPVDGNGSKLIDRVFEWQMLDAYVPSKFSLPRLNSFVEFKYDDDHHLTEMILFENDKRRGSISFLYDNDGVLTNVNWLRER
jgi:hypothetical protein